MGIYAAPPDRRRRPLRLTDPRGLIAVFLAVVSLGTFAVIGDAGLDGAWLALGFGAALLALVLVSPPMRSEKNEQRQAGIPSRMPRSRSPEVRSVPPSESRGSGEGQGTPTQAGGAQHIDSSPPSVDKPDPPIRAPFTRWGRRIATTQRELSSLGDTDAGEEAADSPTPNPLLPVQRQQAEHTPDREGAS
jgi:hypothetical protein